MIQASVLESSIIKTAALLPRRSFVQPKAAPVIKRQTAVVIEQKVIAAKTSTESIAAGEIAAHILMLILIVVSALTIVFGVMQIGRIVVEINQNQSIQMLLTGEV